MLGPNNNNGYTAEDVRENLEEGDMSAGDAALIGATLAQEAYRQGDMGRDEFQGYLDQAEQATVEGYEDVEIPDVDASVEKLEAIDEIHDSQRTYDRAREKFSGHEDLENVDVVASTGPQNIGIGANIADELGLDYTVMVAQDPETESLGPNADEDSVVTVASNSEYTEDKDVELHGDIEDFDGKTTLVAGTTWGKRTEKDSFTDAPKRNSEEMYSIIGHGLGLRDWKLNRPGLGERIKSKFGF